MKRLKIHRAACAVCVLGLLLLIGTAAASDDGAISLGRSAWQSLIGLAMFAGGGTLGGIIEW